MASVALSWLSLFSLCTTTLLLSSPVGAVEDAEQLLLSTISNFMRGDEWIESRDRNIQFTKGENRLAEAFRTAAAVLPRQSHPQTQPQAQPVMLRGDQGPGAGAVTQGASEVSQGLRTTAGAGPLTPGAASISATDAGAERLSSCNRTQAWRTRKFFRNIVLIVHINYGWVAHRTARFWRQVYGHLFDNIVILSDEDIPELGAEARAPERHLKDWRMCYVFLPKIMSRYPDAEGFLWTNDDVVINYWNLLGADKTKLWLPNSPQDPDVRWFPVEHGVKSVWEADWPYQNRWKNVMRYAIARLDTKYKAQYRSNILPHAKEYPKRITDLFYIPRRHVEALSFDLLPTFQMAGAPSELAIPSMFHALDHPRDWDPVLDKMVFRWDLWEGKASFRGPKSNSNGASSFEPSQVWRPDVPAFHPWKISKPSSKAKLVKALARADPCLRKQLKGISLTA